MGVRADRVSITSSSELTVPRRPSSNSIEDLEVRAGEGGVADVPDGALVFVDHDGLVGIRTDAAACRQRLDRNQCKSGFSRPSPQSCDQNSLTKRSSPDVRS